MMSSLNITICGFHYNNKTKSLRIRFSSKYMQDSLHASASYTPATTIFPNTTILMCYFHVKKNIQDNKCVPDKVNDDMITTVESIHADTDGRYSEHHLVMLQKFQT